MMKFIDARLNKVTMYRLTLHFLIILVGISVVCSFFGFLPYSPFDILLSTLFAVVVCYVSNYTFAKLFHAVTNIESVFITALILVLIVPAKLPLNATFIIGASIAAMASKYFVTIEKRHIFNPAAAAVAGIALFSSEHNAVWWVGSPAMVAFVIIGGLLLIRKIRRETLVISFLATYIIITAGASFFHSGTFASVFSLWWEGILQSPLLFFASVMLTEPLTSPPSENLQGYFGSLVAILYATPQTRLLGFALTPEMALCVGNVFSYIVSPKYRLLLPLVEKKQISPDTYLFTFQHAGNFRFTPGQYMEWTLPHRKTDDRGNRRYFSLASSPTEPNPMIAIKFYHPSSSYKSALLHMQTGEKIVAAQLTGDFVMPKNLKKPLVFIAGGVGMAPFRSMIKYIIDSHLTADIIVLFVNRHVDDILFADILEQARQYGVRTVYTLTDKAQIPPDWHGEAGYLTEAMIQKEIPDYHNRTFYISGPQLMVQSYESLLKSMHLKRDQIITDYFPGYVEKR
jgi:glycine betaine catabolism B